MTTTRIRFGRALVAKLSDTRERFHQLVERACAADANATSPSSERPTIAHDAREVRRG